MKKIKELLKKFESWVLSKDWAYNKTTTFYKYLIKILQSQDLRYYTAFINNAVKDKEESLAKTLTTVALTVLKQEIERRGTGIPTSGVPLDVQLNITLRAMEQVYTGLSGIVGIQPMSAPVGQQFRLAYKAQTESGKSEIMAGTNLNDGALIDVPLSLEVTAKAVAAASHRLNAEFSIEAARDLKDIHGLDIQTEVAKVVAAEIAQEVVTKIINELLQNAPRYGTYTINDAAPDAFQGLGVKVSGIANEIARKTRRGAGNFIIVSPMVVSLLHSAAKSDFAPPNEFESGFKGPGNLMYAGTLYGRIKVYSYLWDRSATGITKDYILVGYKGWSVLKRTAFDTDAGYIYSPYVLSAFGLTMNQETFQPSVSTLTRAAYEFSDANYYGVLELEWDFSSVVSPEPVVATESFASEAAATLQAATKKTTKKAVKKTVKRAGPQPPKAAKQLATKKVTKKAVKRKLIKPRKSSSVKASAIPLI